MTIEARRVACVVSVILNPSWLGGLFFVLLAYTERSSHVPWHVVALVAFTFVTLLPLALLLALRASGLLSDVEMRVRQERGRVYAGCALIFAAGAVVLKVLAAPWPVWGLVAVQVPQTLAVLALNRSVKVSIHAMGISGVWGAALFFFGTAAVPLGLLLIAAAWARHMSGAHTIPELVRGALMGIALTPLSLELLRAGLGQ